jgi:hypothetical protein
MVENMVPAWERLGNFHPIIPRICGVGSVGSVGGVVELPGVCTQ